MKEVARSMILSSTSGMVYFENSVIGAWVKNEFPGERAALTALMREDAVGTLPAVTSTETLDEIEKIPLQFQEAHLEVYGRFRIIPPANVPLIDEGVTPQIKSTDADYEILRRLFRKKPTDAMCCMR
jgi:hypothetical protein